MLLLWAGILNLEVTVYHLQEQATRWQGRSGVSSRIVRALPPHILPRLAYRCGHSYPLASWASSCAVTRQKEASGMGWPDSWLRRRELTSNLRAFLDVCP